MKQMGFRRTKTLFPGHQNCGVCHGRNLKFSNGRDRANIRDWLKTLDIDRVIYDLYMDEAEESS